MVGGVNDQAISDSLEAIAQVMVQVYQALQAHENQKKNEEDDEFVGWKSSRRITRLHSREGMILKVPKLGFGRLRRFSQLWHAVMHKRCCSEHICCMRRMSIGGRTLVRG